MVKEIRQKTRNPRPEWGFIDLFLLKFILVQFGLYAKLDQKHKQDTKANWCTWGMAICLLIGYIPGLVLTVPKTRQKIL